MAKDIEIIAKELSPGSLHLQLSSSFPRALARVHGFLLILVPLASATNSRDIEMASWIRVDAIGTSIIILNNNLDVWETLRR